jgi:tRNA (guanine-N7-)-methyltransferase
VEFIDSFFAEGEIDSIWLTFSDPQPKDRKGTKRLTGQFFLKKYMRILKENGVVHLKSDSDFLLAASRESILEEGHNMIAHYTDIYGADWDSFSDTEKEILSTKTFYERKFLDRGKNIHYLKFSFND